MFSIATHHMQCLPDFAAAERHFENTPKPGGIYWDDDERPLGLNRERNKQLIRRAESYRARLYRSDLIYYYPDRIVVYGRWPSMSTAKFIHCVSPFRCWFSAGDLYLGTSTGDYLLTSEGLTIYPDGRVEGAVQLTKDVLDKKRAAATRKKLAEYVTYHKMRRALEDTTYAPGFNHQEVLVGQLLQGNTDPEVYSALYARTGSISELYKIAYKLDGAYDTIPIPLGKIAM